MTSFRLISVAAAALLFVQLHEAGGDAAKEPTFRGMDCLAKMNEVRSAAGLGSFKENKDLEKLILDKEKAKGICKAITDENDSKNIVYNADANAGTFSFYVSAGEDELCSGAVDFWMAYKAPVETPPAYKSDTVPPYNTYQARGFFALFSPEQAPTITCAAVQCPLKEEAKEKVDPQKPAGASNNKPEKGAPSGEKQDVKSPREIMRECNGDRACLLAKSAGAIKNLVCVTSPPALVAEKPPAYTPEQWEKVRAQVSSGKIYSITAATSFVLAASALWLSAF